MDNFFGLGTANVSYDKRRHVNLVYYTMMMLRLTKKENSFMMSLQQILSSGFDKNVRADLICENILTNYEISYLNYLRGRYGLSEDEYVTILAGVTIGDGTVIGAGSVVNKDIPANVIAVGNPCKVLRQIEEKDKFKYPFYEE